MAGGEGGGEEQHGACLVRSGEGKRHDEKQGADPEGDLQDRHRQKGIEGAAPARGQRMAMSRVPKHDDRGEAQQRENAVIELNRGDVLEEIAPPGLELPVARGNEPSVHQREGILGKAGIEPGDEAAGEQGKENQRGDRGCRARQPGGR